MENHRGSWTADVGDRSDGIEVLRDHVFVPHPSSAHDVERIVGVLSTLVLAALVGALYTGPASALWHDALADRNDWIARVVAIGCCVALSDWTQSPGGRTVDLRALTAVAAACVLFLFGRLSADFYTTRASFVVLLGALLATFRGLPALRVAAIPLFALASSIPLPLVIQTQFLLPLRTAAALLASGMLDVVGTGSFREADVLWVASGPIGIASTCTNLRLLGPLVALGAVLALRYRHRWWSRLLVVLAAIPAAVVVDAVHLAAAASRGSEGDPFHSLSVVTPVVCLLITTTSIWIVARVGATRP